MAKATILVVDDDALIVLFLQEALEEKGYRVLVTDSTEVAQVAAAERPDLILLDLMMPRVAGIEVSEGLRANPVTAHIPIVVMSAQRNLDLISRHMPVDDRLGKPFDLADLYAVVAHWTGTE